MGCLQLIERAEFDSSLAARSDTCRRPIDLSSITAGVALSRNILIGKVTRYAVGTRVHALLAADAHAVNIEKWEDDELGEDCEWQSVIQASA